jgi:hypothetical protein
MQKKLEDFHRYRIAEAKNADRTTIVGLSRVCEINEFFHRENTIAARHTILPCPRLVVYNQCLMKRTRTMSTKRTRFHAVLHHLLYFFVFISKEVL